MEKLAKAPNVEIAPTTVDLLAFAKFLAKIAHSYAAAKIPGQFDPFLPGFILKPFSADDEIPVDMFRYIGGDAEKASPSIYLHEWA